MATQAQSPSPLVFVVTPHTSNNFKSGGCTSGRLAGDYPRL